jgi:glycosyltransferase involved in cell wall biosynthesis
MEHDNLRADLHVHSKHSKRPSEWVLKKVGCAESYTDPKRLYEIARERGMDLVTITDHNTLDGSLEIAHLENAFVSEEITAYFPEDRCKIHVLAYDITEKQHEDLSRLRENIFDLVIYLIREKIVHAVAHPMYSINDRLNQNHFEKLLLLFKNFEINGSRDRYQSDILEKILKNLSQEDMKRLADEHELHPLHMEPWKKNLIGGSDDHSSVTIASTYTEVAGASSVGEYLQGIEEHRSVPGGRASGPKSMGHTIYSIAFQFYKDKFRLNRYINDELFLRFADRALIPASVEQESLFDRLRSYLGYRRPKYFQKLEAKTMQDLLKKEARTIIFEDPRIHGMVDLVKQDPREMQEVWFDFVNMISEKVSKRFADSILESLSGANVFDIFNTIGSAGALYTMVAPYFVAFSHFKKDHQFCNECMDSWSKGEKKDTERLNVAHFTDTFYEVNGVAMTLQMQVEVSRKNGKRLTMITCGPESQSEGVTNFEPIGTFEMPEYPEMKLFYPPLLRMLDYCYAKEFTHIHAATPGPIGLAALAIARILKLPIYGTYHTALPQYADELMQDPAMGEIMWRYVVWFYNQMDVAYVPSHATGAELVAKGVQKEKIQFYPRGIDVERFRPSKRNGFLKNNFQVSDRNLKLLYVGRVSREKNLPLLAGAFEKLAKARKDIHLIVIGNGPYLADMKKALEGLPATFTGYLAGDDLAQAYASCDVFVFPSTTDTFGNVVLEAQASGLPVIVTAEGGPKENMVDGKTGFVVQASDVNGYIRAILRLADDRQLLEQMRVNARHYTEGRSFESAYLKLWESYRDPQTSQCVY